MVLNPVIVDPVIINGHRRFNVPQLTKISPIVGNTLVSILHVESVFATGGINGSSCWL